MLGQECVAGACGTGQPGYGLGLSLGTLIEARREPVRAHLRCILLCLIRDLAVPAQPLVPLYLNYIPTRHHTTL